MSTDLVPWALRPSVASRLPSKSRPMLKQFAAILLILVAAWAAPAHGEGGCDRIVSLAPSVTEVLFDLGLGGNVIGRTRFCRYPAEAASVPEVGGLYDVSVEAIVALKPTHIVTLRESADAARQAARFGAQVIEVDHSRVAGINDSLKIIGSRCGAQQAAESRLAEWRRAESRIQQAVKGTRPIRTLVVVGRAAQGNSLSAIYVSGSDGFYTDVLALAGAVNVHDKPTVALPVVSPEGLLALRPEAILEIQNIDDAKSPGDLDSWSQYPSLPAVRNGRIFPISDDYASIPGPRYIQLVERVASLLHGVPELAGGAS